MSQLNRKTGLEHEIIIEWIYCEDV
jgi:hypothetical protein